jgi:hypothetical protein
MQFQKDIAPPRTSNKITPTEAEPIESDEPSAFSKALAAVEGHRTKVRVALGAALVARLLFEFKFVALLKSSSNLVVQVPYIGLAMLSYLLVLMWLAARTRDRFGFGMALGIGVLEATYLLVLAVMARPWSIVETWPLLVVGIAHVPMAYFAINAARAYPAQDSKQPWLVGFITALAFLAIPLLAPTLVDLIGR